MPIFWMEVGMSLMFLGILLITHAARLITAPGHLGIIKLFDLSTWAIRAIGLKSRLGLVCMALLRLGELILTVVLIPLAS